jgi:hypothetical protein
VQMPKATHPPVTPNGQDSGARRAWRAGFERVAKRRQVKAARPVLSQDPEARERPHEAVERGGVGSGRPGKRLGALGSIRQVVSQAQFGCDVNDLGHPVGHGHLDQLGVRGCCLSFVLLVLGHIILFLLRYPLRSSFFVT